MLNHFRLQIESTIFKFRSTAEPTPALAQYPISATSVSSFFWKQFFWRNQVSLSFFFHGRFTQLYLLNKFLTPSVLPVQKIWSKRNFFCLGSILRSLSTTCKSGSNVISAFLGLYRFFIESPVIEHVAKIHFIVLDLCEEAWQVKRDC
jgi:hypothetical protein